MLTKETGTGRLGFMDPPPPSPSGPDDNSDIRSIECWLYADDTQPPIIKSQLIEESKIPDWFREAPPRSFDDKSPSAGIRVICRNQERSDTAVFKEDNLNTINKFLGIPEDHTYLRPRDCGVFGHYLGNNSRPGSFVPYVYASTNIHMPVGMY